VETEDSGWPDATEGLYALKKSKIIATLSNGNVRLLVDVVSAKPKGPNLQKS
jgi:hypothetical protein